MADLASTILHVIGELRSGDRVYGERAGWHPKHVAAVERAIRGRAPIRLALPAFPAKSPNAAKTIGARADLGEVLALRRLDELCRRIEAVHAPGAQLIVCSDGRAFGDLVEVDDARIDAYKEDLRRIVEADGLKRLSFFGLENCFGGNDYDGMRRRLMLGYGESLEALRARVRSRLEDKALFCGIHRFLFEDHLALHPDVGRSQARERTKEKTYQTILRSNAWSRVIEERFPDALRLSIHPQPPFSEKIGVQLLPSEDVWRTPWHAATYFDGREHRLAPRRWIERAGGSLRCVEGGYGYYVLEAGLSQAASL